MKTLLITFLILLLTGCGSRKAEIERLSREIKEQRELVWKFQSDVQSNVNIHKVATKKIIESKDPDKPSIYNGQEFQNAKITEEEVITDSTENINDQSSEELKIGEESEIDLKEKNKKSESKKPNPWLWMGIASVVGVIVWRLSKSLNLKNLFNGK